MAHNVHLVIMGSHPTAEILIGFAILLINSDLEFLKFQKSFFHHKQNLVFT